MILSAARGTTTSCEEHVVKGCAISPALIAWVLSLQNRGRWSGVCRARDRERIAKVEFTYIIYIYGWV